MFTDFCLRQSRANLQFLRYMDCTASLHVFDIMIFNIAQYNMIVPLLDKKKKLIHFYNIYLRLKLIKILSWLIELAVGKTWNIKYL